ncbi:MAG: hypothetical protein Q7R39_02905 [Dehalococcoidia bacterium]|nr:hypothetical protein [Dehalococcoidia bacterium]
MKRLAALTGLLAAAETVQHVVEQRTTATKKKNKPGREVRRAEVSARRVHKVAVKKATVARAANRRREHKAVRRQSR